MSSRAKTYAVAMGLVLGWAGNAWANGYLCQGHVAGDHYRVSLDTDQRWNQTFTVPESLEVLDQTDDGWRTIMAVGSEEIGVDYTDSTVIYRVVSREPGTGRFVSADLEVFRDLGVEFHESSSYFALLTLSRNGQRLPVKMVCDSQENE